MVTGPAWAQIAPLDAEAEAAGVVYEELLSSGWCVAATLIYDNDGLELMEVKLFPGGARVRSVEAEGRGEPGPGVPAPGKWALEPEHFHGVAPGGITTRLIRQVGIGDLIARATLLLEEERAEGGRLADYADFLLEAPLARPGRAGREDLFYARWAARYDEKLRVGSRSPVTELAAEQNLKREQVRDIIRKARVRGLLTAGRRGKSVGTLTHKARALLSAKEE